MKIVTLAFIGLMAAFAQPTQAQEEVWNCEGESKFGAITTITVSEDWQNIKVDFIGNRARKGSDTGTRVEGRRSPVFQLKKFKDFTVTFTSMRVRDEQGRALKKVQIHHKEPDRVLNNYMTILCLEEKNEEAAE